MMAQIQMVLFALWVWKYGSARIACIIGNDQHSNTKKVMCEEGTDRQTGAWKKYHGHDCDRLHGEAVFPRLLRELVTIDGIFPAELED